MIYQKIGKFASSKQSLQEHVQQVPAMVDRATETHQEDQCSSADVHDLKEALDMENLNNKKLKKDYEDLRVKVNQLQTAIDVMVKKSKLTTIYIIQKLII
jgi:hypothetical protein